MSNLHEFNDNAGADSPTALVIPTWVEDDPKRGRVSYDIFSRMLKENIVMLNGPVNDQMAAVIIPQLLLLDAQGTKDITMYINSPGGSVTAGMAIFDTMRSLKNDVCTVGIGQNCSMGSFLLAGGTKGKRFALPNTRIMTHQPSAGTQGKVSDMERHMDEFQKTKERMKQYYMHFMDMGSKDFEKLYDRDTFFNALAGVELGHIDEVIMKANMTPTENLSPEDKALFDVEMAVMEKENKKDKLISKLIAKRRDKISNDNDFGAPSPEA